MRRPQTEPMLSIYAAHDRELMFHGDITACHAHGVRVKKDCSSLTLDGKRYKILQQDYSYPPRVGRVLGGRMTAAYAFLDACLITAYYLLATAG